MLAWVAETSGDESASASDVGSSLDPIAVIALALSIIGILVTVFLRYLDGPRVKVRVRPVLFSVGLSGTITYHGGRWPIPEIEDGVAMRRPDRGEVVELAEIVIENAGRHPTTVYEIGFRWLGKRTKWWRRRARNSVVPLPLRPPGQEGRVYADGDQFRIEPSDVVTVLVNYWDYVRQHRPAPRGRIELRGAVRVAGRRRLKLSRRRDRWRISDDAVTSMGTATKIPLRAVITKSLALSLLGFKSEQLGDIYFLSRSLEAALEGTWSGDFKENHDRLQHFEESSSVHLLPYKDAWTKTTLMWSVHTAIDAHKDIIDWADIKQPGLHKMFSEQARGEEKAAAPRAEKPVPKAPTVVVAEKSTGRLET